MGPAATIVSKAKPPAPPPADDAYAEEQWEELKQRLRSLPGWTRRRVLTGGFVDFRMHLIRRLSTDVREQLHRREAAKAAVLELGGEVRRVHLELGRRFVERGLLTQPDEIELLTSAEVMANRMTGPGEVLDDQTDDRPTDRRPIAPDVIRRRRNWLSRYQAEGALTDTSAAPMMQAAAARGQDIQINESDVNASVVRAIAHHIRQVAGERAGELTLDTNIVLDLGLDSLERLE